MADCIIFGAGKIARGFIAHLLYGAGLRFAFVEKDRRTVETLNRQGWYTINVLGAPEKNARISGYTALTTDDTEGIRREMAGARLLFTAVGGKNLDALAPVVAWALQHATVAPVNVITCENWKEPAAQLRKGVLAIDPGLRAGFGEAVVMRSAIEPDAEQVKADPLVVNVQDYWKLPVDAGALIQPFPAIPGMEPMDNFAGFLERKFYTYNAANATVSYLGALLGLRLISEAALDSRVAPVLEQVYRETSAALCARHAIRLEEQQAFADSSRKKLQDTVIVDLIERNARDPLRKLGREDRLVGPALMAMHYNIRPEGLCTAIAAALHYKQAGDASAEELAGLMESQGLEGTLQSVSGLQPGHPLIRLVQEKEQDLLNRGWIGTKQARQVHPT